MQLCLFKNELIYAVVTDSFHAFTNNFLHPDIPRALHICLARVIHAAHGQVYVFICTCHLNEYVNKCHTKPLNVKLKLYIEDGNV